MASTETVMLFAETRHYTLEPRVTAEHEMRLNLAVAAEDADLIRQIIFDQVGLGTQARDWRLAEIKQTVEYLLGFLTHRTKLSPASRLGLVQEALLAQVGRGLRRRNLEEIVAALDQWIDEVFGAREAVATSLTMRQTVRQVKDHIQEHYFETLSLATLAESFRVDSSYLSKVYKQVTGTNLMAAIARCRIEKAKEYIRDRNLSLTEVASLVGYEEYAYFNRVFRKVEGVSPTEFRSSHGRKTHADH
jgi:AraC-like DNA-binding protein